MKDILVFDNETTGLTLHPQADVRKQPKMIEFGGLLLSRTDGSIIEEFSILIDPREPLEAIITKITGLTDADLAGAPTFAEALPQLRRIFESCDAVIAHNLPFDKAIVLGELARNSITEFPWPGRELCTVGLYKEQWGRNPKMLELYEVVMGKPLGQTHRALDDALALAEIVRKEELWRLI